MRRSLRLFMPPRGAAGVVSCHLRSSLMSKLQFQASVACSDRCHVCIALTRYIAVVRAKMQITSVRYSVPDLDVLESVTRRARIPSCNFSNISSESSLRLSQDNPALSASTACDNLINPSMSNLFVSSSCIRYCRSFITHPFLLGIYYDREDAC